MYPHCQVRYCVKLIQAQGNHVVKQLQRSIFKLKNVLMYAVERNLKSTKGGKELVSIACPTSVAYNRWDKKL